MERPIERCIILFPAVGYEVKRISARFRIRTCFDDAGSELRTGIWTFKRFSGPGQLSRSEVPGCFRDWHPEHLM